jgi:hypothetical protein
MPINVPDHDAVVREAQKHKFREPLIDESDDQYRTALADHVFKIDKVAGHEIRTGRGWDEWTASDRSDFIART